MRARVADGLKAAHTDVRPSRRDHVKETIYYASPSFAVWAVLTLSPIHSCQPVPLCWPPPSRPFLVMAEKGATARLRRAVKGVSVRHYLSTCA